MKFISIIISDFGFSHLECIAVTEQIFGRFLDVILLGRVDIAVTERLCDKEDVSRFVIKLRSVRFAQFVRCDVLLGADQRCVLRY